MNMSFLSTIIPDRQSFTRWCFVRKLTMIALGLIAVMSSPAPARAQTNATILLYNKTDNTFDISGSVDGVWTPNITCGSISGCLSNPDGSPPRKLGPKQVLAFGSKNGTGFLNGTGGKLTISQVGSFTWTVPLGYFIGLPNTYCDSKIIAEGGSTFPAATLSGGLLSTTSGQPQNTCPFSFGLTDGNVKKTEQEFITAGQALSRGTPENIVSSRDGRYALQLQTDGDLTLIDTGVNPQHPIWAANTSNTSASVALMQTDGDFVLYDQNGNALWASKTAGNPGAFLTVEDGFFTIHMSDGTPLVNYGVDQALYAAIWEKRSSVPWVARHGLTAAQYQQQFDTLESQGYRPVAVSGYSVFDQALYAAIWEKRPSVPWVARHGLTSEQYQQQFNSLVGQGYKLVQVSGYSVGGQALYAAIWEQSSSTVPWVARHGLTPTQYQQEFDNLTGQGYRPVDVNGYSVP
ncbi:MAG: hypothetical protein JOY85_22195 [Acidobacteriaceae bacterium]|nr:hypothetical protein [Acidobacteriaceae bacterium]